LALENNRSGSGLQVSEKDMRQRDLIGLDTSMAELLLPLLDEDLDSSFFDDHEPGGETGRRNADDGSTGDTTERPAPRQPGKLTAPGSSHSNAPGIQNAVGNAL
jgi:hypothetical protein